MIRSWTPSHVESLGAESTPTNKRWWLGSSDAPTPYIESLGSMLLKTLQGEHLGHYSLSAAPRK